MLLFKLGLLISSPAELHHRSRQKDHADCTGGDNFNKRCFATKPKLLRESGDFSGNRDTGKFFRETRDNSGTLQKKILECMSGILKISGKVTQKFGRMIQISGTTYVKVVLKQRLLELSPPVRLKNCKCKLTVTNFFKLRVISVNLQL